MEHRKYEHSHDFEDCDICGAKVTKLEFDSPLYCDKCIAEMEKLEMTPRKYGKYLELKGDFSKPES